MSFQGFIKTTGIGFSLLYLCACASTPNLPDKDAEYFYKQEGIIETYYEQVTSSNSEEMQAFLYKLDVKKWHGWDTWRPKVKFLPEDELWYFSTDPKSWKNLAGRMGFCVFRNGEIITRYTTLLNWLFKSFTAVRENLNDLFPLLQIKTQRP